MAKQNESTMKFKADIAELKKGMQEAKTSISQANAVFSESTQHLGKWQRTSEGVEAKIRQLKTTLENQTKVLNNYRDQLARTVEEYGEGSIEAEKLREKIERQKVVVSRTRTELGKFERSLEKVKEAEEMAAREGISVDEAFDKIKRSAKQAEDAVEDASDGFTVMKGAMASLVAEGIKSFIGGIINAVEETREFRNELAMLEATANTTGAGFAKAQENLKNIATITNDTGAGVEAVNNMMSAGFKGDNLDALTEQLLGASIKWKDTLKMEGLADGLQETLATNAAIGPFAELLERGGQNLETFNAGLAECTTEAEKQNYILQELSKLGLTDVLDEYKENNKWMLMNAEASYSLQEAMSQFATKIEPAVASVKQGLADMFSIFLNMGEGINVEGFAEKISGAFGVVKNVITGQMSIGELMNMGANWLSSIGDGLVQNIPILINKGLDMLLGFTGSIREHAPNLIQSGLDLIENLVKGIMDSLPSLISKVPTIVSNIANVINDNIPKLLKTGFDIVVSIIKGIISAIPTLIMNIPKIISAIVDVWSAFNWINLGKTAVKNLGDGMDSLKEWLKGIGQKVSESAAQFFKDLPGNLKEIGKSAMSNLGDAIKSALGTIKSAAKTIYDGVVSAFKDLPGKMLSIGKDIVKGLWNGISDMTGWVIDKIQGFGDSVLNGLRDFFGIHSPSTLMRDQVGRYLAEGIGEGFTGRMSSVVKDMKSSLGSVSANLSPTIATASSGGAVVGGGGTTYNFYQTNNSPKSLSRLEIYRQSKNLLSLKGV